MDTSTPPLVDHPPTVSGRGILAIGREGRHKNRSVQFFLPSIKKRYSLISTSKIHHDVRSTPPLQTRQKNAGGLAEKNASRKAMKNLHLTFFAHILGVPMNSKNEELCCVPTFRP
jgi:hypothetical protein